RRRRRRVEGGGGRRPCAGFYGSAAGDELAGDQDLLDLVGAVVDLEHARVAIVLLDRVVGHEAVAAVDLDGRRADALAHLGGEELRHRRLLDAAPPDSFSSAACRHIWRATSTSVAIS